LTEKVFKSKGEDLYFYFAIDFINNNPNCDINDITPEFCNDFLLENLKILRKENLA
jgi:hypothetical protein